MPNFANLLAILAAFTTHVQALQAKGAPVAQADVDTLTQALNAVDTEAATLLATPAGPGPTGNLDFTAFDAAVAAFKADGKLAQADVDAVAHVLSINTP